MDEMNNTIINETEKVIEQAAAAVVAEAPKGNYGGKIAAGIGGVAAVAALGYAIYRGVKRHKAKKEQKATDVAAVDNIKVAEKDFVEDHKDEESEE